MVPGAARLRGVTEPHLRLATRAIVLDPCDRILLVRFDFGDRVVWATPGGGIEEGETDERAVRRELAEEAGLEEFELGPSSGRAHTMYRSEAGGGTARPSGTTSFARLRSSRFPCSAGTSSEQRG